MILLRRVDGQSSRTLLVGLCLRAFRCGRARPRGAHFAFLLGADERSRLAGARLIRGTPTPLEQDTPWHLLQRTRPACGDVGYSDAPRNRSFACRATRCTCTREATRTAEHTGRIKAGEPIDTMSEADQPFPGFRRRSGLALDRATPFDIVSAAFESAGLS